MPDLPLPGSKNELPFIDKGVVFSVTPALFGVFDGMGGEKQGEMAAYIAAKTACNIALEGAPLERLNAFCQLANDSICQYASEHGNHAMGTTAAMLFFTKEGVHLCNIGDSKVFLFSGHRLQQISEDHVSIGVCGKKPPLLQNLGIPPCEMYIRPYLSSGLYHDGDIYLICSDGLTDMVSTEEMEQVLANVPFSEQAQLLLDIALNYGGKDNITILLCKIQRAKFQMKAFFKGRERKDGTY